MVILRRNVASPVSRVVLPILFTLFTAGCPPPPISVVGGTWAMNADYIQLPGGSLSGIHEQWFFTFHEDGTVTLTIAGIDLVGTYTLGSSQSIVNISCWFETQDTQVLYLSTTLVIRFGRLEGQFYASYSEWMADIMEQINGIRFTSAQGTLGGGRIIKMRPDEYGLVDALRSSN